MSLTTINSNNIFQKKVIGNVRKAQEDSHDFAALTPNGDVFVVCDGMGGHVGGKTASTIAVNSILEYLKAAKYDSSLQALDTALQVANRNILQYAAEHPELKGMGTTACILLLQDDEAYIAHTGDSRIYLYLDKEKQLHRITKDHSFVQTLVDLPEGHPDKISDEDAEKHPNKNRILKALGIKPELQPTFNYQNKPIYPKNGDIFLICSDGLSGMIDDNTIKSVLSTNDSIEKKGDMLISLALENGGLDNITVELVQIDNSPWEKSEFRSYNPTASKKGKVENNKGSSKLWLKIAAAVVLSIVVLVGLLALGKKKNKESAQKILSDLEQDIIRLESGINDLNKLIIKESLASGDTTILSNQKQLKTDSLVYIKQDLIPKYEQIINPTNP
jgi:serine/threonine protein phosphatase PrpC